MTPLSSARATSIQYGAAYRRVRGSNYTEAESPRIDKKFGRCFSIVLRSLCVTRVPCFEYKRKTGTAVGG